MQQRPPFGLRKPTERTSPDTSASRSRTSSSCPRAYGQHQEYSRLRQRRKDGLRFSAPARNHLHLLLIAGGHHLASSNSSQRGPCSFHSTCDGLALAPRKPFDLGVNIGDVQLDLVEVLARQPPHFCFESRLTLARDVCSRLPAPLSPPVATVHTRATVDSGTAAISPLCRERTQASATAVAA